LVFNFVLEYAIRTVQVNQEASSYADNVNTLSRSVHTTKKIIEALVVANKDIELKVTAGKTKYTAMSGIRIQDEVKI
jgi:hypothetical protein